MRKPDPLRARGNQGTITLCFFSVASGWIGCSITFPRAILSQNLDCGNNCISPLDTESRLLWKIIYIVGDRYVGLKRVAALPTIAIGIV